MKTLTGFLRLLTFKYYLMKFKSIFFILILFSFCSLAQQPVVVTEDLQGLDSLSKTATLIFTDTLVDKPNIAALYSAILPGMGQVYNNKPWKIPVIYSGFIFLGYVIKYNNDAFKEARAALFAVTDDDPRTNPKPPLDVASIDAINLRNDAFRRNRDYAIILTIAWYLLNIVDAHVDGHLNEFTISDDLSLNIGSPSEPVGYSVANVGLAVKINF